jgi:hypothetical protein
VTALPAQSGRDFVFSINDPPSGNNLILAAADFKEIESWMLCMIQTINGDYKDDENFEMDLSVRRSASGSFCAELSTTGYLTVQIFHMMSKESGDEYQERSATSPAVSSDQVQQCGYLFKHSKSAVLKNDIWKRRYFVLDRIRGMLCWYESEQDFVLHPQNFISHRIIDRFTRVVLTGHIQQGGGSGSEHAEEDRGDQPPASKWCCFSLVCGLDPARSKNGSSGEVKLLRLCSSSEETVVQWMVVLEREVSQLTDNVESIARRSPRGHREGRAGFPASSRRTQRRTFLTRGSAAVRLLVRPRGDFLEADEVFQTFYMRYFVQPCSSPMSSLSADDQQQARDERKFGGEQEEGGDMMKYIRVVVYENQRLSSQFLGGGWHNRHLLVSDPPKLSNVEGVKFISRYLKRTNPPVGYRWLDGRDPELAGGSGSGGAAEGTDEDKGPGRAVVEAGLRRFSVVNCEEGDESGWKYAASFDGGDGNGSYGVVSSNASHWHDKMLLDDVVRRRKLFRVAVLHT